MIQNELVRDAALLYAMVYAFTVDSCIVENSINGVMHSLHLNGPLQATYTPRSDLLVINIQVKHVLCDLMRGTFKKVLVGFEKQIYNHCWKEPKCWAPAMVSILTLCLCAELVPVMLDYKNVRTMQQGLPGASRQSILDVLDNLDKHIIAAQVELFHDAFKTLDTKKAGTAKGFNPIHRGLRINNDKGLGEDVVAFVGDMRRIIWRHRKSLPSSSDCNKVY